VLKGGRKGEPGKKREWGLINPHCWLLKRRGRRARTFTQRSSINRTTGSLRKRKIAMGEKETLREMMKKTTRTHQLVKERGNERIET